MVDPDNPREPVQVVMANLPWQIEAWQMVKRQGPLALVALAAVWFLWGQWQADRVAWEVRQAEIAARNSATAIAVAKEATDTAKALAAAHEQAVAKLAQQQTQQMKDAADVFRSEQDRTERILGGQIKFNMTQLGEVAKEVAKKADKVDQ